MKKIFSVIFLWVIVVSFIFAQEKVTLQQGTRVNVKSLETVSTKTTLEGDRISFATVEDIKVDGKTIVPAGTKVVGIAEEIQTSRIVGLPGHIKIKLDHILMADGSRIYLSGRAYKKGKSRMTGVIVGACFVWPLIFITGPKTVMPEGFEAEAEIQTNTVVAL